MKHNVFSLPEAKSLRLIENLIKNHQDKIVYVGCKIDYHTDYFYKNLVRTIS
jgi:GMP synthase PP-ATPase subunit